MFFGSSTNGNSALNCSVPISWVSNSWYQVVLTYTPTNSALYINGQLATNGTGVAYFPNSNERSASGFRIGSDSSGYSQARGIFDELETFGYPLEAGLIQANYQSCANLDSDGDGLSNLLESILGTSPYNYDSPNGLTAGNGVQVFTPLR